MKQFGLYANQDKDTSHAYPYFIDVQNDLLDGLKSRVVIPIIAREKSKSASSTYPQHLCPVVEIRRKKYVLMTHQMTSVPVQMLKSDEGSLSKYRNEIVAAIDFLVTGI